MSGLLALPGDLGQKLVAAIQAASSSAIFEIAKRPVKLDEGRMVCCREGARIATLPSTITDAGS
jgi:hypothetical protein